MSAHSGSKITVYAALAGNLLIVITKFVAASLTGSSAMLSEGIHSLVDSGNEMLLLYGMHRAERPADRNHPLGHGRELYFWSFIVALLVFAFGAGVSFYEGVQHLIDPNPIENVMITYVVLAASFAFEAGSWIIALRTLRRQKGTLGYFAAIRESKDPTVFTVLFEDSAALIGLVIAAAGITAAHYLDMPEFDGLASIGIGLVLTITAIFLARECKGLLIGERALPSVEAQISNTVSNDPGVKLVNGVVTAHLGPNQIVAGLSVNFDEKLTVPALEACIERIERHLRQIYPEISTIFIKPQRPGSWMRRQNLLAVATAQGNTLDPDRHQS